MPECHSLSRKSSSACQALPLRSRHSVSFGERYAAAALAACITNFRSARMGQRVF